MSLPGWITSGGTGVYVHPAILGPAPVKQGGKGLVGPRSPSPCNTPNKSPPRNTRPSWEACRQSEPPATQAIPLAACGVEPPHRCTHPNGIMGQTNGQVNKHRDSVNTSRDRNVSAPLGCRRRSSSRRHGAAHRRIRALEERRLRLLERTASLLARVAPRAPTRARAGHGALELINRHRVRRPVVELRRSSAMRAPRSAARARGNR